MINRDSLYNVLLNVAELKIDNAFLKKKVSNQKLIIITQGLVIKSEEIKTSILTKQIKTERKARKKQWFKTVVVGILGFLIGANL